MTSKMYCVRKREREVERWRKRERGRVSYIRRVLRE